MTKHFVREEFDNTGDELIAITQYGINGNQGAYDHRLVIQSSPTGLDSSTPSGAAFLIREETTQSISEKVQATGHIIARCTPQPITTKNGKLKLPAVDETSRQNGSRFGGFSLSWVDEAAQLPTSLPKFGALEFHPKLLGGICYATNEMLADVPAFGAWFERTAAKEIAFDLEDSIVNGTGSGQPLGILNSGALVSVTPDSGSSTLRASNCTRMASRLWAGSYDSDGTCWLTNTDGFRQLVDETQANGAPLVDFDADGPVRHSIFGWPLIVTEYTAELGLRGSLILADLREYIICERDSSVVQSIHVKWLEDQSALRVLARVDAQASWASPVTPKSGSATQSPFVTLGAL